MNINSVNEKLLNVLYYSPSTGISSVKKLYEKVKQRGITFQQVKDYISKQETHQIFKKQPRSKNYFPIVAKYKNEVLQIDLADMSNISSVNDGVKFLFIAIDVFSRLAYVIPLRNKKIPTIIDAFTQIIDETKPHIINCDNGSEWISTLFKKLCKDNNIQIN